MPKIRFPVGDIQGLQPAIDTRGVQKPYGSGNKTYALEGRNFYFDTRGPKSGFGTRLVADNSIIENAGGVVQSITAGKATYVFTSKGCYVMADNRKSWIRVLDLASRWPDVPLKDDKKWTFVYLSKGIYFCHPVYGFYKVVKTPTDYYLDPRDQNDILGLPFQPQAICETNGRMVVLGFKYVAWSGPSNAEDFLPALGGAGQELLSDRVAGTPVTCVGFQTGFIVWTSQGCLTAEFIGGDTVFRFNRATTEQLPVNAYAVEALPDGSQVICTKQGIFQIQNAQEPQLIAPLFSEFVKQRLEHENGVHVRLTYQLEEDLLFFQMRDWTNHYVHTFVCSLSIDKWGSFNERHLGIIKLIPDRGHWGYVDSAGRPHRFVDVFNREVTPHHFIGLDSNLTIGYIRPPELLAETDSLQEMHEINIGGYPAIPSWYQVDNVDLGTLPTVFLTGHLHIHGFDAVFGTPDTCETNAQTPTWTIAGGLDTLAMNSNWDQQHSTPSDIWDNTGYRATGVNLDTGDIFVYVNNAGDYTAPDYATNTSFLMSIQSDGAAAIKYDPGPFNVAAQSTTHFGCYNSNLYVDRHDGDVWGIHDWYLANGSTLARSVATNAYVFQSIMFPTLRTEPDHLAPDTGLGQNNQILGFTTDNIILLHEVDGNLQFKLETLDKDTLTRISQAYISPGVGSVNGPIPVGAYFGINNFCIGPDEKVYHATHVTSEVAFDNGTCCLMMRYDPISGIYTDISPWSDSDLPLVFDGATATNIGVKHIYYDRILDRICVIFGYSYGVDTGVNGQYAWSVGAFNTADDTWENLGLIPQFGYLDSSYAETVEGVGAAYFVGGLAIMDSIKNADSLPMATPCQEYLHTVEFIWKTNAGSFDPSDSTDPTIAGARICIRDPSDGFRVKMQFLDLLTNRYDSIATPLFVSQFLATELPESNNQWGVANDLSGVLYLPNRKYYRPASSVQQGIDGKQQFILNQHANSRDWNFDFNQVYTFLEP